MGLKRGEVGVEASGELMFNIFVGVGWCTGEEVGLVVHLLEG